MTLLATHAQLPERIDSLAMLEELLSEPTAVATAALARHAGDLLVLGVGGKMGPTLARMAVRASAAAGLSRRVIGVSRFSQRGLREELEQVGVETIAADLLDPQAVADLPDAPLVMVMTGMKFGASSQASLTWAMNAHLPSLIAARFRHSRIVVFSTGNVYPLTPVVWGGARETDPCGPVGEYAMSCLGRERIYEHFSRTQGTPMAVLRLNYANELRYGVMVDIASQVAAGNEIDLSMGCFNAIWQADANAMALAAFDHVDTPPPVFNLAGPETLAVRRVAEHFAERFGCTARFRGVEAADALLSDGQRALRLWGYPRVGPATLIDWIAVWLASGGPTLGKPTHFETRDGKF